MPVGRLCFISKICFAIFLKTWPAQIWTDMALNGWGVLFGRIHAVGALSIFQERPTLNLETFGLASRDYLLSNNFIPPELLAAWSSVVDQALISVQHCYDRAGSVNTLRLHGDCHPGNILWTDDGPHFVDFDDCRQGPAIQDLWMLLSGDRDEQQQQIS